MGLGKKLLGALVEEVPEEIYSDLDYSEEYESSTEKEGVVVSLDNVEVSNIISDIYAQNDLIKDANIFKVEELSNNLPNEMATDTKRKTVQGILTSFGISITDVVFDGDRRREVLDSALSTITDESSSKIKNLEEEIESYKLKISDLEKIIAEEKSRVKTSTEVITSEIEKVVSLVKFIGGE